MQHPQGRKRRNPDMRVKKKKIPQSPWYGSPPPCSPNRVPMERDAPSPKPVVYSFIYICWSPQKGDPPPQNAGKHIVTIHGAPSKWKAYIQWGMAWFPKGVINDIASRNKVLVKYVCFAHKVVYVWWSKCIVQISVCTNTVCSKLIPKPRLQLAYLISYIN